MRSKMIEIKNRSVDAAKPGVLVSELAAIGRRAYSDLDVEFKWAITWRLHRACDSRGPQIYPHVDLPIEGGMMMMIEVDYTNLGRDSFHVEDLIEIKPNGAEYITDAAGHEQLWEID
jgi:Xaa-Pro aminopeptidase